MDKIRSVSDTTSQSLFDFIFPKTMRNQAGLSDTEANALYTLWKNSPKGATRFAATEGIDSHSLVALKTKGYLVGFGNSLELTEKGKKIIVEMATHEPNAFEKHAETLSYSGIKATTNKRPRQAFFNKQAGKENDMLKKASKQTIKEAITGAIIWLQHNVPSSNLGWEQFAHYDSVMKRLEAAYRELEEENPVATPIADKLLQQEKGWDFIPTTSTKSYNLRKESVLKLSAHKQAGLEPPYPVSALDGMSNDKAKRIVNQILATHTPPGLVHDDNWSNVHAMFKAMDEQKINYSITKADYNHDAENRPSGKQWRFEVYFTNRAGKPTILYGNIVASGAGTVENPLAAYDVVAYVS